MATGTWLSVRTRTFIDTRRLSNPLYHLRILAYEKLKFGDKLQFGRKLAGFELFYLASSFVRDHLVLGANLFRESM